MEPKKYVKLNKLENYDREAVEELAEAVAEKNLLKARIDFLDDLIDANDELLQFVWTSADDTVRALHKIEQDHFINILQHIADRGSKPNPAIAREAERRKLPVPLPKPKPELGQFTSTNISNIFRAGMIG